MRIEIEPSKLSGSVRIPSSKSHTIRAVAIASLADGFRVAFAPVPLLLGWKPYWIMPVAVVGTVLVGYALLRWKGIAPRAG